MEFLATFLLEFFKGMEGDVDAHVVVLILAVSGVLYWKVLKPMKARIDLIPTSPECQVLIDTQTSDSKAEMGELLDKLDGIIESLSEIGDLDGSSYKEIITLKRDVEGIKKILNQFQGHFLYSNSRGGDFGNRELK